MSPDWREVCDGRIDCIGGEAEAQCFQLKVNQCNENEYRFHNRLRISKTFLDDNVPHCLDQSDVLDGNFYRHTVYPYIFNYKDVDGRLSSAQFSCVDGECVANNDECQVG